MRTKVSTKRFLLTMLAVFLPIALCMAAMATKGYERYGSIGWFVILTAIIIGGNVKIQLDHSKNATQSQCRPGKKFYWYAGLALDVLHIPGVLALAVVGSLWFPAWLYAFIMGAIVFLQIGFLCCPLIIVSTWLKRLYMPSYAANISTSLTAYLYRRLGRWAAVPIFVLFMVAAAVVKYLLVR